MQNPSIKYILKLSIPIFFANLAIPLVGIIDTGLMGNLGNLSYLAATEVADKYDKLPRLPISWYY